MFFSKSNKKAQASFEYIVLWQYSLNDWEKIHDIDNGNTLHVWHGQMIKSLYDTLEKDEKQAITDHRERSYMHYNPIDAKNAEEKIDIEKLLQK